MSGGTWQGWMPREGTTDQRIIDHVYYENGYEMPDSLDSKYVIDIGANIGTFSRLCAERGATVLAYEPHPDNYERLCDHVKGMTVTPVQVGLGPDYQPAKLWIHESNTGGHSITERVGERSIDITALPLAYVLNSFPCDILKLDCEGAEVYAFESILSGNHSRVPEIVCEIHEPDLTVKMAIVARLEQFYVATNIFQADWRFVHR